MDWPCVCITWRNDEENQPYILRVYPLFFSASILGCNVWIFVKSMLLVNPVVTQWQLTNPNSLHSDLSCLWAGQLLASGNLLKRRPSFLKCQNFGESLQAIVGWGFWAELACIWLAFATFISNLSIIHVHHIHCSTIQFFLSKDEFSRYVPAPLKLCNITTLSVYIVLLLEHIYKSLFIDKGMFAENGLR